MEQLVEQPEKLRSFDLLASVNMMRFDIQRFNQVLPETRQRVYDEELSLMAEGVDRASCTAFTLQSQDGQLVYFDNADWRPYIGMLNTGLEAAKQEAEADARRNFLVEWAAEDQYRGYRMQALKPGEQMVWHNAYPQAVEDRYGVKFMEDCGLVPQRKMGFIYRAARQEDGSVKLETQTIDGNDTEGFAAVQRLAAENPAASMTDLVAAYDEVLALKFNETFYAGRRGVDRYENAWEELLRHKDLIAYFLDELEVLAASDLPIETLERQVKQHVIGCWKAFKTRLAGQTQPLAAAVPNPLGYVALPYERLALEVKTSFTEAWRLGEVKTGCGGSISAREENNLSINGLDTFDAIFGEARQENSTSAEEDKFGSLTFECPKGHVNRRPRNKLIEHCKTCGTSVKC